MRSRSRTCTRFVVDGEIVAFEGRRTSFARLQGRLGITDPDEARASDIPVFYYVFDLLHLDNKATTELPLIWRKRLLRKDFRIRRSAALHHASGQRTVRPLIARRVERGDEGVIAKLADSPYEGGRSTNWLKFKCSRDQEFVSRRLHRAERQPGRARRAAAGLPRRRRPGLRRQGRHGIRHGDAAQPARAVVAHRAGRRHRSPVARIREPGAHWVRPKLVAQVAFSEWTRDGKLRHPRYLGLRTDKKPDEVVRETR